MTFKEAKIKILKERIKKYEKEIEKMFLTKEVNDSLDLEMKLIDIGFWKEYGIYDYYLAYAISSENKKKIDFDDLTIKDLISCDPIRLSSYYNVGYESMKKVYEWLDKVNLEFVDNFNN